MYIPKVSPDIAGVISLGSVPRKTPHIAVCPPQKPTAAVVIIL